MKYQEIDLETSFLVNVMILSDKTEEKIMAFRIVLEKKNMDEAVITTVISSLPGKYKEIAEKGKKPEIPYNDETMKLIKILDARGYISSYSVTKNGIRVNTKLK